MLHAVIMAGGSGTRFWPESRTARPKQLLRLADERSMIAATVARLGDLVPAERVLVVTNDVQRPGIVAELPALPSDAVLAEPCKRDTAPCIGLAAICISRHDPDATLAVMPSDHVIVTDEAFQDALELAEQLVDESPRRIVTFGIRPTYPAETFGYIERGAPLDAKYQNVFRVTRFREKPKAEAAREYLASGNFYWNSGIFIWQAKTILDALERHQPEMFAHLKTIAAAWDTPARDEVLRREFAAIKPISIDYAVMEKADEVVVIEAPFDWDDVGGWQSFARLRGADDAGNTISGRHLGVRTANTIVRTDEKHLVATLGVQDLLIVHTPDATLVANRHDEEAIRELVRLIEEHGWHEYL
ncbi:MAG: mannose-1-phosphate guanylyltransferase [Pirellulales bacterium]|nr:mannose-1-phosphate guanylyltransferase [Pirellulales bacterium]